MVAVLGDSAGGGKASAPLFLHTQLWEVSLAVTGLQGQLAPCVGSVSKTTTPLQLGRTGDAPGSCRQNVPRVPRGSGAHPPQCTMRGCVIWGLLVTSGPGHSGTCIWTLCSQKQGEVTGRQVNTMVFVVHLLPHGDSIHIVKHP